MSAGRREFRTCGSHADFRRLWANKMGMIVQPAVKSLQMLGALPDSVSADVSNLEKFEKYLGEVKRPVSNDDARALSELFGHDDCFGLAWALVHLIETAPDWPLDDVFLRSDNPWLTLLRERSER